jgi:predicted lipid-binding transport protein (Tim44 family)
MRTWITYLLLVLLASSVVIQEASAGRFGGGRSFGVQRSHSSLFSPQAPQNSKFFGQRANSGHLKSALGGFLAGGLLASLFMGHGLGSGLFSWLILGVVAYVVVGFLRSRMQSGFRMAQPQMNANAFRQQGFNQTADFQTHTGSGAAQGASYPAGFVPDAFLRSAKVTFIRLQAAFDQKNLQDLAEFTAPDVYAEIKIQLDERGNAANSTEIVRVDAELLDVSKQANGTLASVRFTGAIKENNAPMTSLDEIWHFRQFAHHSAWVVAGIQQEVVVPQ